LSGIDWSKSDRTLLLALSTTNVHFCAESAPFYKTLQQQKRDNVRLLALFPQPLLDSRTYLDNLGLNVDEVVQIPLNSVGASGTPTLLLIDTRARVINSGLGNCQTMLPNEVRLPTVDKFGGHPDANKIVISKNLLVVGYVIVAVVGLRIATRSLPQSRIHRNAIALW